MTILKIVGWIFLAFVLFQALFNPWTPIFYIWRRWVSEFKEFVLRKIETPRTETGGTFKITLKDHSWENFVEATLLEFKKKYIWSRKPTWVFRSGLASHSSVDGYGVERCVHDWIESHPDATIENTCQTYVLRTKLQRLEDDRVEYFQLIEKLTKNSKIMLEMSAAYKKILDETNLHEDNIKRLMERIETICKAEVKRQESIKNFYERIDKLSEEIETLKAA